MTYITRTMSLLVLPEGEDSFSESATRVSVIDEAAGEFVIVEQERGSIAIDTEEWPALRAAIDRMVKECRG